MARDGDPGGGEGQGEHPRIPAATSFSGGRKLLPGPCPRGRAVWSDYTPGGGSAEMSAADKSPQPPVETAPRHCSADSHGPGVAGRTPLGQHELLRQGEGSRPCRSRWARLKATRGSQSSMASSWSARASNMVLMSSRMCLVEVPGGLQQEGNQVRAENGPWGDQGLCLSSWLAPSPLRASHFSWPPGAAGAPGPDVRALGLRRNRCTQAQCLHVAATRIPHWSDLGDFRTGLLPFQQPKDLSPPTPAPRARHHSQDPREEELGGAIPPWQPSPSLPARPAPLTPLAPQCQCSSLRPLTQLPGMSWSVPASAGPGRSPRPQCSLALEEARGGDQAGEPA